MLLPNIVNLTVGELDFSGLRIRFEVNASYQQSIATAVVTVYGMKEGSYSSLKEYDAVRLSVPAKAGEEVLFFGSLINRERFKQNEEIITTIYCNAGFGIYENLQIKNTFKKGTKAETVLSWLKNQFNQYDFILSENAERTINNKIFSNGLTLIAKTGYKALSQFFKTQLKLPFYIDNNVVVVGRPKTNEFFISAESNMIGHPSRDYSTVDVSAILMPRVRPGDFVIVDAKYFNYSAGDKRYVTQQKTTATGSYTVSNYIHRGDTHSTDSMRTDLYLLDENI